jgi:hypothetical protein
MPLGLLFADDGIVSNNPRFALRLYRGTRKIRLA